MKPEARVRMDCRRLAAQLGFHVYDLEQGYRPDRGGSRVTPGVPDLCLIGRGTLVWVECKAGGGTQSLAQQAFQHVCEANQVVYLLARSAPELLEGLRALELVPEVTP